MYETFFGLREEPFRLTSDPKFFHAAEPHVAALNTLVDAVTRRKGFVLVTGPCGTGKTTVVHAALHILSDRAKTRQPISTAFVFNPTLSREEFLEMTLAEFEISCLATSKPARLAALHKMLLETYSNGGTSLLLVDEAHLLTDELLEEIRLLSNADTYNEKLLQIVLCGQPELLTLLSRPELRSLRQRIASSCSLRPLTFEEVQAYVAERLHSAGFRGTTSPFSTPVLEEIFRRTEGVPRLINLLCDACLTIACKGQKQRIDLAVVEQAASHLVGDEVYVEQHLGAASVAADTVFAPDAADAVQSNLGNGSAPPFASEEAILQKPSHAASPAELPAFVAVEIPPLAAEQAILHQPSHTASPAELAVSVAVEDLPVAAEQAILQEPSHAPSPAELAAFVALEVPPVAAEETNLHQPSRAPAPAELSACVVVEDLPFAAETHTLTAVQECEATSTPMENSYTPVFLNDLIPASPAPEQDLAAHTLYLDLIAAASGPAGPLITERKRHSVTVLGAPPVPWMGSRTEHEPPSTAKRSPIPLAMHRALTLESVNQLSVHSRRMSIYALLLSWKWGSLLWINRFLLSISLAKWPRESFAVLVRRIRQSALPLQPLLRHCWFDFKRDWNAMLDAMALPKMKRSLLRWLNQPIR
jgi:general secretion pathway protein A